MDFVSRVLGSRIEIAYHQHGDPAGWPVVLLHGFPYDPRCYENVADELVADGARVVVPYVRGFGPSIYRSADTLRSGQQAALAHDLHELIDALGLHRPIVAGFDWGGRAACVTAMLWPSSVSGLVTVGGYNVHDISAMAATPDPPAMESRMWYQWYFHSDRGRAGLARYRRELTRQLWTEWSPGWNIPDGAFEATAASFDNPDFVDTVIHSYRHRYGLAAGDPVYEDSETTIAQTPPISVPTIVIDLTEDPVLETKPEAAHAARFTDLVDYRRIATGHNTPQENPVAFAEAIRTLHRNVSDIARASSENPTPR
ncbi:alpha/beta fold hydrolase [Phytoactinopolyspora endophytica]|uniref:alpha/beta fold hydrolase n=1 Tax=Phytoactinopolyspora endophytica TaxID=1642495 RepID=UPI00197C47AF|nr:alpha/beta hydrolase [Phytoactinopolyspora endophytica]